MFLHVELFFNSELDKLKLSPFTIMPKHKQPVNTIKRFIFSITILPTNPLGQRLMNIRMRGL